MSACVLTTFNMKELWLLCQKKKKNFFIAKHVNISYSIVKFKWALAPYLHDPLIVWPLSARMMWKFSDTMLKCGEEKSVEALDNSVVCSTAADNNIYGWQSLMFTCKCPSSRIQTGRPKSLKLSSRNIKDVSSYIWACDDSWNLNAVTESSSRVSLVLPEVRKISHGQQVTAPNVALWTHFRKLVCVSVYSLIWQCKR